MLSQMKDDDDICVLLWEKSLYDYDDDDEMVLTAEAWAEICAEFDDWLEAGMFVSEWIADSVIEKCEPNRRSGRFGEVRR